MPLLRSYNQKDASGSINISSLRDSEQILRRVNIRAAGKLTICKSTTRARKPSLTEDDREDPGTALHGLALPDATLYDRTPVARRTSLSGNSFPATRCLRSAASNRWASLCRAFVRARDPPPTSGRAC